MPGYHMWIFLVCIWMRRANVELTGPFGYKDRSSVETGPNAAMTFSIPDNAVPVD
jgi:hypothetical protein